MKRTFKNLNTGHVFFDIYNDGILRSTKSATTYTLKEAIESSELIETTQHQPGTKTTNQ